MSHGQSFRPVTKDGKRVDVDDDGRSALATADVPVAELLAELLTEVKKVRLLLEILAEEEI